MFGLFTTNDGGGGVHLNRHRYEIIVGKSVMFRQTRCQQSTDTKGKNKPSHVTGSCVLSFLLLVWTYLNKHYWVDRLKQLGQFDWPNRGE